MEYKDAYYIECDTGSGILNYNYYNDDNILRVLGDTEEDVKCIIERLDKVRSMKAALTYFMKYDSPNIAFRNLLDEILHDEE